MLFSRAIVATARLITSACFAMLPFQVLSTLSAWVSGVGFSWSSMIVYYFVLVDYSITALSTFLIVPGDTVAVAPDLLTMERFGIAMAAVLLWTMFETFCAVWKAWHAVFVPMLGFLFVHLLVDFSILWVVAVADGLTYDQFIDLLTTTVHGLPRIDDDSKKDD